MSDPDCLFCNILAGDVPAEIIYESDTVIAFRDINPRAPMHVLIVPREHISTINDIDTEHEAIVGSLFTAARDIAAQEGVSEEGYRAVMNCNSDGGQSVFHLHLHVLGGRMLTWPPG